MRRACPLCGGCWSRTHLRDGDWRLVECAGCGHVHLVDPPEERALLAEIYDDRYWRSGDPSRRGYADYFGEEHLQLATMRRRAAILQPRPGERVLEVGCGGGTFLAAARELGAVVQGVEPSAIAAARAMERLAGARVHHGTLADRADDGARFDCIAYIDSLEHVRDPRAELRRASALLAAGGRVAILTQDVSSVAARLLGARWPHYKQPEHLHHFSPRTLGALLEDVGFHVERTTREATGKFVSPSFVAERLGRVAPWLAPLARPLAALAPAAMWADLRDSFWCIGRRSPIAREQARKAA
ncbi:MAG: class I SAM-dependent methyltransferase [Planctomycetia bacterium]